MILCVSNQNYAGYGHLAYYWSPDWGDTWIGHPDNPIIAPGQFPDGVPAEGFQRTPTMLIDEEYNRYILAYNAGHDINEKWKRRTYLATASRPENLPPEKPQTPSGPLNGKTEIQYIYSTSTIDPDGDQVAFNFDWDDGTTSGWTEFIDSGQITSATKIWYTEGTYKIKVVAKDEHSKISDWSEELEVTITKKSRTINTTIFTWLQNHLNIFPILHRLLQRLGIQN
jgi:hypothetical protein